MINELSFWRYSIIRFPFADGSFFKRRPALVLRNFNDDDIIVCRITSLILNTDFDIAIPDWKATGLLLPSIIRTHKLATLEKRLIEKKIGTLNLQTKTEVFAAFISIINYNKK